MNYTTNYRIQKPFNTEKYNVDIYNTNADIIDSALNRLELENVSQDALLATKEELSNSNRSIENEIQRATAKENEILDNLNTNKTIWDNKYTREEIDDKFDGIVIPTKISDLENDCNFNSGIKGIKGDNESEYHTEEYVNLTAESVGALPINGIADKALKDSDGGIISTKYALQSLVGAEREVLNGTNIEYSYPDPRIDNYMSITSIGSESLTKALKSATLQISTAVNNLKEESVKYSSVLQSYEEIAANTDSNNVAGALALKESINSLQQSIDQLNSNLSKRVIDNFNDVLDAYGINKSDRFNSLSELNLLLPINIHTFCTINTDATAWKLANAVPQKYGILEIIKGYNNGFCTFIFYGSTVEETYYYTSRFVNNENEVSSQKWRKVIWEYVV